MTDHQNRRLSQFEEGLKEAERKANETIKRIEKDVQSEGNAEALGEFLLLLAFAAIGFLVSLF